MKKSTYRIMAYAAAAAISPFALWRALTHPAWRAGLAQKLGFSLPRHETKTIWVHAVSVGEALAAEGLVKELRKEAPGMETVLTVTTPTGYEVARKKLSGVAQVLYFPFDLPGAARRAVAAINPALYVTIDTEIWPSVIWACKDAGAKVAMVNGRVSDRSYPRYRRLAWFFRDVLSSIDLLLMQGSADAERIISIGADPSKVETVGNIKFDGLIVTVSETDRKEIRRSLGIGAGEPVIFLGSVHEGEEGAIRAALRASKKTGARVVIAPRRIEDISWIEKALEGSGMRAARKTSMTQQPVADETIIPVIDTFGELSRLYAVADVVFVGGSLIDHGGQNPLEPAAHGIAPLFGPSMSNFRDASSVLLEADGAWMVSNERELEGKLIELLKDQDKRSRAGQAARAVVEKNRGVTAKVARRLLELARRL